MEEDIHKKRIDIYVGNSNYSVDFLKDKNKEKFASYIGSLEL